MKMARIKTVLFSIGAGILLTACLNGAATALKSGETGQISPAPTPTPDLSIPDGWVLFPAPNAESAARTCANGAIEKERKVALGGAQINISRYLYRSNEQLAKLPPELRTPVAKEKLLKGYMHVEAFENGWLVGSDAGEWGGKLFWLNADGTRKTELLNDNIRGIVKLGKEVFILSGMAHMGTDEGKIYRLKPAEKDAPQIQLTADLKTQPQSFAVESDESFLLATNTKILRVAASGEITTLKETNFLSLYPNSMAVTPAGVVYVGMRLFVVRFVPQEKGYAEEWLVAADCQKFVEKDFDCVCRK
jgi:hypothetical protein